MARTPSAVAGGRSGGAAPVSHPCGQWPPGRPQKTSDVDPSYPGTSDMNELQTLEEQLRGQLGSVVLGMEDALRTLTIALLARGHVLVQGPPGLGKTLLSKSMARVLGGT